MMNTLTKLYVFNRAVSVNALIYAINAAAINAIKYFNAINATLKKNKKWQEARRRRGGESIGKLHQARLEPVSPRAM